MAVGRGVTVGRGVAVCVVVGVTVAVGVAVAVGGDGRGVGLRVGSARAVAAS